MKNTIIKYGAIGGTLVSVLFLGPMLLFPYYFTDPSSMAYSEVIGYSTMILSMLTVHFGTRHYRNEFFPTDFSFTKGLKVSILITLVASLVFFLGNILLYEVLAPNFLSDFSEPYKEYLLSNASNELERTKVLEEFEKSKMFIESSFFNAALMAVTVFLIGLVISLISALTLTKK
jgi:hypothetical protein